MEVRCNAEIDTIYGLGSYWMFPHGNYYGTLGFYGIRMPMKDNMLARLFEYLEVREEDKWKNG